MKTSGCCGEQHPDVLYKNMGMFLLQKCTFIYNKKVQ